MNYRNIDKKRTVTITKDDVLSGDLIIPAYKNQLVIDSPVTISGDVTLEKKLTFENPSMSPFYNLEKTMTNMDSVISKINKLENMVDMFNKTKIEKLEKYVNKLIKEQLDPKLLNSIENFFIKYDIPKIEKLTEYIDNVDNNKCISTKVITSIQDVTYFNIKISDKYTTKYVVYNLIVVVMSKKGRCYTNIKFFYDPDRENKNFSIISKEVAPDNYYNCSLEYTKDKILKFNFSTEKIGFDNLVLSLYTSH
jgi:hypothetical protein